MKHLVLIALLGGALAAQNQGEPKVPGLPDLGDPLKLTPQLPAKAGVAAPAPTLPLPPSARDLDAKAVAAAAQKGIRAALGETVCFDQPQPGGPLWALGRGYKAAFDADGWRFIAQPLPTSSSQPIAFRLAGANVGGKALDVGAVAPVRKDQRVEYAHAGVLEAYDLGRDGVEQSFTFRSLPQRGELELTIAVDSELTGFDLGQGIAFRSDATQVGYGEAVAIDASGERCAAPTAYDNGRISIRVPAAFVQRAALPLVVDPLVSNTAARTDTVDLGEPDVAWDESNLVWAVSCQRLYSATDWDMFVQRLDSNLNPVGSTTIDITGDRWQRGRIANLGAYDLFCVVAEVRAGSNPAKIGARIMSANNGTTTTGQFDVATYSVDALNPDVGGDPATAPTYFTVVWEYAYSATDHDIYARQITDQGVLRGTAATAIQTSTVNQTRPSISKSDGAPPYATQRFTIVYQQTFSATDEDVYGAMLTWNGNLVPVNGNNTFAINTSGLSDLWPKVSSPTLTTPGGNRHILVVHERPASNNGDVVATCIDENGVYQGSANVNVLENNTSRLTWPQYLPNVDCDGARFAVSYHEVFGGSGSDLDTRASLLAMVNGSLVLQEGGVTLAYTGNPEFNVAVASRYSGSGSHSQRYCTVNDRDGGATPFAIDAYTYDGYGPGGYSTRPTGCGGLTITPSNEPILGEIVGFNLTGGSGLLGFIVGFPTATPIGPCPGCTIGVAGVNVIGGSINLQIPLNTVFVGATFAVQGFQFAGSGPCLGAISLSDTVDMTVR